MAGEADIIQSYFAPLAAGYPGAVGLRDDAAVVTVPTGFELVATIDAVASGVHFFADDGPADIGWKALAVNVSDLVAKGAVPHTYLMSLAFPQLPDPAWLAQFASGLRDAQSAFGITLIGGDTDRRPGPVSITISAFGLVGAGAIVRRGSARIGDRVFVSSTLGDSALGLALRLGTLDAVACHLSLKEREYLLARYLRPNPPVALAGVIGQYGHASMDISDGLLKDLGRMTAASGVGAVIEASALPLSSASARVLGVFPHWLTAIVGGGDDYQVLVTVPDGRAAAFVEAADAVGVAICEIGRIIEGAGVTLIGSDGQPICVAAGQDGWDHF